MEDPNYDGYMYARVVKMENILHTQMQDKIITASSKCIKLILK